MAVNIRIGTAFDPKGLNQAQRAFNKIQGNINNLSRNFAIAGTAFAGIAVGLGKSVKVASDLGESVNAINVAFGSSAKGILDFGKTAATTLGVSAVDFNNAAVRFSAFADRIVGSGGDAAGFIAEISTRAADFASVFNIEVAEALGVFQSGLAGEAEPLKRFGINLLDSEVKAYAMANGIGEVGRQLTETEKVQARYGLLMEATAKTQGDFANTSDGLANGMRILKAQVEDTAAEVGLALLPALQDLLPVIRDLILEFSPKLKSAIEAVNFEGLLNSLIELLTFFVRHIEVISKTVVTIFTLNTAYNLLKITIGLTNAVLALFNLGVGQTATASATATKILGGLRTALLLGGVTLAVGSVIDEYRRLKEVISEARSEVNRFNEESIAVSGAAAKLNPINTLWQNITKSILGAITATKKFKNESGGVSQAIMDSEARRDAAMAARGAGFSSGLPDLTAEIPSVINRGGGGGSGSSITSPLNQLIADSKKNATIVKKQSTLERKGLSAEVAQWVTSSNKPVKAANEAIQRITKNGNKAIGNLTKAYTKSAAGQAAAAASAASEISSSFTAAYDDTAQKEAEALAERERVYQSFQDSVKNTFAGIKNSILGAFDITELGGSTSSIARNMDKLLAKLRSFTTNVRNLAGMGLDPALLQQVISAGPVAGARLASALVAGGAGALANLNRGYAEFGVLASEIATTGTESLFNRSSQQNVYNINVSGGVGSGATIGQAIVDAIKAYERTSGAVWVGA